MRRIALLLACLSLTPVHAATPLDGTYRGGATLFSTKGGNVNCRNGSQFAITVRDGAFEWRFENGSTTVPLAADGSFNAQNGRRFIAGKVADGKLTARTTGEFCVYDWTLTR